MASLYKKCPKCGVDSAGLDVCPACGLIFAKYLRTKFATPEMRPRRTVQIDDEDSLITRAKEVVFYIPEQTDSLAVYARALLLAAIVFYGVRLALMDIPSWEM